VNILDPTYLYISDHMVDVESGAPDPVAELIETFILPGEIIVSVKVWEHFRRKKLLHMGKERQRKFSRNKILNIGKARRRQWNFGIGFTVGPHPNATRRRAATRPYPLRALQSTCRGAHSRSHRRWICKTPGSPSGQCAIHDASDPDTVYPVAKGRIALPLRKERVAWIYSNQ
jgi:hypothetical protein